MKSSYFTTPRSLSECNFIVSADPIDRPDPRDRGSVSVTFVVGCCITLGALFMVLSVLSRQ